MFRRVPIPHRFNLLRGRTGRDVTALHGKKTASHRRATHGVCVALCQLLDIDLIENGEAAQLGRGVGCGNFRCDKKECEKGYGQIFHGLLNYWALADGCKWEYVIA